MATLLRKPSAKLFCNPHFPSKDHCVPPSGKSRWILRPCLRPKFWKPICSSNDPPRVRKANYLLAAQAGNSPLPASYPCPVQVFRFGNELLLIALGGEPVVDYAARLKTEFAGPMVWVAGYSNDMFGYLPSRRVQREGGYEGGRALLWSALPGPFTETVEERIFAAILDMARQNR